MMDTETGDTSDAGRRYACVAERLQRRVAELAPGVMHELSTPAQYIGDNLHYIATVLQDLANKGSDDADTNAQLLDACNAVAESLEGLDELRGLLTDYRWYVTPAPPAWTECDLNGTVEKIVRISRNGWKHVMTISTDLATDLDPVGCRPDELKAAVSTVLFTAIDVLKGEGPTSRTLPTLHVSTSRTDTVSILRCSSVSRQQHGADAALASRATDDVSPVGTLHVTSGNGNCVVTLELPRIDYTTR
jgi:hypothetical protein